MLEIRLSNVTKSYPKKGTKEKTEVLHGINATFCGGKLYVIKGISGSGKTTLLNLIGGIDRKYEGEISYSEARLKKASYVFQESLLLTGLTVRENLDLIFPGSSEIDPLAERLGVKDLLSRKTEGLSGGERQRIAILRALLQGASLILADEPTASLDGENSERVAELLNTLKAQERIILVATHEHFFDEMADSILYLKNGVIDRIEEKIPEGEAEGSSDRTDIGSGKQHGSPLKWISGIARNYSYIWKRRKKEFSLRAAFPIAVSLALLLVVSVIQRNLMSELVREYKSVYPMDMFETRPEKMKEFLAYPEVTPYYDYRIKGDSLGSYTYSLLPEEYSCFSLPKVIEYGAFPKEADEVIITPELAKKLGATDPKSFIGTEITFCGEQFRVSGILGGPDRIKPIFREGNYSMVKLAPEAAFALYDTVKEKGDIWHGAYDANVKCIWPGLSESEERQEFVKKLNGYTSPSGGSAPGSVSSYYAELEEIQKYADLYSYFFYFVMILIFLLTGVFLCSLIHVDLFYRRRELGYLQIFGMKKSRVTKMLLREYLMKYLLSFALSFVIFGIALVACSIWRGRFLFPDWKVCMIMEAILLLIHMGAVFIGISTFLRKSPSELIGRT